MKSLKTTYLLVLLCFVVGLTTSAQQISKAEYYLDTDPGVGNGIDIPLTPGESINLTHSIDISALEPGQHNFSVRVMDENGVWSIGGSKVFYIEPELLTGEILAAEYFFDSDPGVGNGNSMAVSNGDVVDEIQEITIPMDMENGDHRLYVRVMSSDNVWSQYANHYFTVCDYYGPVSDFDVQINPYRWVAFTDQSENATSHLWDFDDGSTDTAANPNHYYTNPGIYNVTHYAINGCGPDTLTKTIEVRGIYNITANKGSNTGASTVLIRGNGFTQNFIPSLEREGYSSISPHDFELIDDNTIRALFDLRDQEIGFYDVNVEVPGDTTFVLEEAYEIVDDPQNDLVVSLAGRTKFLANRDNNFIISVRNNGLEDVVGLPLVIKNIDDFVNLGTGEISKNDFWTDPHYGDLTSYVTSNSIDSANVEYGFYDESIEKHGVAFIIPIIPSGSKLDYVIKINSSEVAYLYPQFRIGTQGYLASTTLIDEDELLTPYNCRSGEFRSALEMGLDTTFEDSDWEACFESANQISLSYLKTQATSTATSNDLIGYQAFNGVMIESISSCLLSESLNAEQFEDVMTLLNERFNTLDLIIEADDLCDELFFANAFNNMNWEDQLLLLGNEEEQNQVFNPEFIRDGEETGSVRRGLAYGAGADPQLWAALSMDPNEKVGPPRYYLNEKQLMHYSIHFENVDSASAAAGLVRIVDTLDVSKYDLTTMKFESFGFNNNVYSGVQEENSMFAIIDLRPERPVYLKMNAFMDPQSGHTEWVFESLDVNTLQLTDDPDGGFLLPNVNHPEGEGFVNFSIELTENLITGDVINNKAEIIFDSNEPIETGYFTNVFDDGLPLSEIQELSDTSFTETFTVEWEGIDEVSGIAFYDIYVGSIEESDTNITIWRYHTLDSSAEFHGEFGEKYYFYSIASDNAGNTELETGEFDTEIEVSDPCLTMAFSNLNYEICEGDSMQIEGNWYSESGLYIDTLNGAYACDSVVYSQLTVNLIPAQPIVYLIDGVLSTDLAESYQWYLNGEPIEEAINQEFIPSETGNYYVEISNESACTNISDEVSVIINGIEDYGIFGQIEIFPNPTQGELTLSALPEGELSIDVYSSRGRKVLHIQSSDDLLKLNLAKFEKGIYYLRIRKDDQSMERKIIVN